jgi:hypothetical protein
VIKAIETVYKGYRFRSRLEARWAVFFDALGIEWEYEAEGFELGANGRYLPDFWLPRLDCWVEIKPGGYRTDRQESDKYMALAQESPGDVLLHVGDPWPNAYVIVVFHVDEHFSMVTGGQWEQCRKCDGWNIGDPNIGCMTIGPHSCGNRWKGSMPASTLLVDAYKAARGARFEYGEVGAARR